MGKQNVLSSEYYLEGKYFLNTEINYSCNHSSYEPEGDLVRVCGDKEKWTDSNGVVTSEGPKCKLSKIIYVFIILIFFCLIETLKNITQAIVIYL